MIINKFKTLLLTLAFVMVSTPFFQSCSTDSDNMFFTIATFRITENNEVYFVLDQGEKMYANIQSSGRIEDGQRVYVSFDILDEPMSGYDYNIRVLDIQEILTIAPITLTEENAHSIGDDKINITDMWFGDGYLNIQFQFYGTRNSSKQHLFNLVYNAIEDVDKDTEDGYVNLELRHNAYDNQPIEIFSGIAAFKGPFADKNMKGLKVRYNSIYDNIKYRKIDF